MSTTYTANLKLGKPTVGDTNWNLPLNANIDAIEAFAPLSALAVTPAEVPSASLNVAVAPGKFLRCTGQIASYAGTSSQAITASTTKVLYLDTAAALQVGSAYPTTAHTRLATVTAGTGTITTIVDDRITAVELLGSFASAADDSAAATAGVPIGCLYQDTTGVVRVRLT